MKAFFLLHVFVILLFDLLVKNQTAKCDDIERGYFNSSRYASAVIDDMNRQDLLLETDRAYREPAVEGPPIYDDEGPVALDQAGQSNPTATGDPLILGDSDSSDYR